MWLYDFIGVYQTSIISTVAKKMPIDLPIKLLLPKLFQDGFTMIGLGDLIIPGLFISFCLRIDFTRGYQLKKSCITEKNKEFTY